MLQAEYKRVYTAWDHIQEDSKSYTRDKRRDNRIKLVEAEEPDRETTKKQIQWYLKHDRQKEQEIEYRYATGHLVRSTAVPEIITAQDQEEQPTEPDRVQMICYPWLVDYIERDRAGSHGRDLSGQFTHGGV